MTGRTYFDSGFILRRKTHGEADRILTILTKNHGRVSLIAKGIRRIKSRKRGHLEVFTLIDFQATNGKGIGILTEAETIDNFEKIRKNLNKISLAYYFLEVIAKITHEHEKNTEIFNLLFKYLKRIELETALRSLRRQFIYEILTLAGFWPKHKILSNPDKVLEEVIERSIFSARVGKIVLN